MHDIIQYIISYSIQYITRLSYYYTIILDKSKNPENMPRTGEALDKSKNPENMPRTGEALDKS